MCSMQLAEDNGTNQMIACQILKKYVEAPVVVANNGTEAVEAAKAQHFDVCLMDVQVRAVAASACHPA